MMNTLPYQEVWAVDFEFRALTGERPEPICMVAREFHTGRTIRLWQSELLRLERPPYPVDSTALLVAYHASAELGCHLALGWPMPARILDLCAEFKCLTAGLTVPCGRDLLGALAYHGLSGIGAFEKESMRDLALRGGPWTEKERTALLDYCESDVVALVKLLPAMGGKLDLPRALLRGRYMAAVAKMEWTGVPIDLDYLKQLRAGWDGLKEKLIQRIDAGRGIYEGQGFRADRWAAWLIERNIPWPRLESGGLALDDDTFRDMAKMYSEVAPIRELRHALSQMRLEELAVGGDGRNRCMLSPFASKTGRNQPSNTRYIFGPAVWLRSLIRPDPGKAVAYVDYEQQEFGIAAALSGDVNMMAAYQTGDPYLAFAVQAGAAPPNATKKSHGEVRERFKTCALGVQYSMWEVSLAQRLNISRADARNLLRLHHQTYPTFWRWSDSAVDHAILTGKLHTAFGWTVHVSAGVNPRSLRNFPMQANGAEMLRLACCLATERGYSVCAPVHDALLIEGPADQIETVVAGVQQAMREASELVLNGFPLRTEAKIVRYPDRYTDGRGEKMWSVVSELLTAAKHRAG